MTLCPFALMTGIACPGCGMTRAVGRLVQGDWVGAVAYHPLVSVMIVVGVGGAIWFLGTRLRGWPPLAGRSLNVGMAVLALSFLGVWLLRLATGSLPPV